MAKSIKAELNKHLSSLSKEELEHEVKKLFQKIPAVKQYYELELSNDTSALVEEVKSKIKKEYFPSRGFGKGRSSVSRKLITDFKKISVFDVDVAELLLYRVEMMLAYTNQYGDIDEPFYNSLLSSFEEACKIVAKAGLHADFRDKFQNLIKQAGNFGWGVSEEMEEYCQQYLQA